MRFHNSTLEGSSGITALFVWVVKSRHEHVSTKTDDTITTDMEHKTLKPNYYYYYYQ